MVTEERERRQDGVESSRGWNIRERAPRSEVSQHAWGQFRTMDLHPPTSTSTDWLVCQETAKKHPAGNERLAFGHGDHGGSGAIS
jgi:hypothetical protein